MSRESEIPLSECPHARLPYPTDEEEGSLLPQKDKRPEGGPEDNWIDDSFHLDISDGNLLEIPVQVGEPGRNTHQQRENSGYNLRPRN